MIRYKIIVTGKVQGVGFRYAALHFAQGMAVEGIVRNLPDGSVEIDVQGSDNDVDALVAWCYRGPQRARVDKVELEQFPLRSFAGFQIK